MQKRRFIRIVLASAYALVLAAGAGCRTREDKGRLLEADAASVPQAEPAVVATVPEALPAGTEPAPPVDWLAEIGKYRIGPGDLLHVKVQGEADLSDDFKVLPDGTIIYAYLGRIPVAGFSVAAVESNLTAVLGRDYLVNPKVYVQVKSSVQRRVIVFGEVKSPGIYEMPVGERFSLLQVIARAGGPTDLAATDRVRVVRRTEGGAEKAIRVNVTELLRGGGEARDVDLRPDDVVIVPQTVF